MPLTFYIELDGGESLALGGQRQSVRIWWSTCLVERQNGDWHHAPDQ